MPRPAIDLEPWKEFIKESVLTRGYTVAELRESLLEQGVVVSSATLNRNMANWNVSIYLPRTPDSPALRALIITMFYQWRLTDKEMVDLLAIDGYKLTIYTLKRLRLKMGLLKRIYPWQEEDLQVEIRALLQQEYEKGGIEDFGRGNLYTFMRNKYRQQHIIGRDRLYRIARQLNPDGLLRRQKKMRSRRGAVIIPGPNYTWSMDAYCKLEHWGIQIYAAIDAYSRCIMWIYVGITGRSSVSVFAQYIAALVNGGAMPRYIRSDRGAETTMAADAHYQLSLRLRSPRSASPHTNDGESALDPRLRPIGRHEQPPQESLEDELTFAECFKFGTSKQNQRIESWWGEMSATSLARWRLFFQELQDAHLFNKLLAVDRIAFVAVYVPIIRAEATQFVHLWNSHKIRKQSNRPYTVPGIPTVLYHYPENAGGEQQGFEVPLDALQPFLKDLDGFDIDEHLPQSTIEWCREKVIREFGLAQSAEGLAGGFVNGTDTTDSGERLHYKVYLFLRDEIALHTVGNGFPILSEADKPYGARNWVPAPQVVHAFNAGPMDVLPHDSADQWLNDGLCEPESPQGTL